MKTDIEFKEGDMIRIVHMDGEPQYTGAEGRIDFIGRDPWGDVYYRGSWGGCSVYPHLDEIEKI